MEASCSTVFSRLLCDWLKLGISPQLISCFRIHAFPQGLPVPEKKIYVKLNPASKQSPFVMRVIGKGKRDDCSTRRGNLTKMIDVSLSFSLLEQLVPPFSRTTTNNNHPAVLGHDRLLVGTLKHHAEISASQTYTNIYLTSRIS